MVALMTVFQIGEFFRKREGNRLVASRGREVIYPVN